MSYGVLKMHTVDEKGRWIVQDGARMLVELSEEYAEYLAMEKQKGEEQELLESLKPSEKEILMAEIQLNVIELLIESEVI